MPGKVIQVKRHEKLGLLERLYVPMIVKGFAVTFEKLFHGTETGKVVTTDYPKEKRPKAERLHGRHVLNRYEDGMEKCIGCELCAGVCPARCIYVRGADNDPEDPTSPGERFGFKAFATETSDSFERFCSTVARQPFAPFPPVR